MTIKKQLFFTIIIAVAFLSQSSYAQQMGVFIDSNNDLKYKTVIIGEQTWMAESLNYETADSYWYNNNKANGDIYGRLYTWNAALNACLDGWRLPINGEWKTL